TSTAGQAILEQAGTGDVGLLFSLTGVKNWIVGVDNSDGDKFKIENGNTVGASNDYVIDSSGNIGIGTSTPIADLHVYGASSRGNLRLEGNAADHATAAIELRNNHASGSFRGLGTYYYDSVDTNEWFVGTPYSAADAKFVINYQDN